MKGYTKQSCIIEFLHAEKLTPIDIKQWLMNTYGDQTGYEGRQSVMCFSSTESDVCDKPYLQVGHTDFYITV